MLLVSENMYEYCMYTSNAWYFYFVLFISFAALVRHVYDFKPWISKSLFLIWFPLRLLVHVYTVSDIWTYHISLSYNPSFYTSAFFSFAPLPAIFVYTLFYQIFRIFLLFGLFHRHVAVAIFVQEATTVLKMYILMGQYHKIFEIKFLSRISLYYIYDVDFRSLSLCHWHR